MRLDKYLKVSRIIKRRTVAKDVCDAGRISVNGRPAKAGTEVNVGDHLLLNFSSNLMEVEIISIAETVKAEDAKNMYQILRQERIQREEDF